MEARREEKWTLLERLVDGQLQWRQLIGEANGGDRALQRIPENQIKRQEVIHELVQTERHHCLTLAFMRQVYLSGLRRLNELRCEQHSHTKQPDCPPPDLIDLERLFPALEELIQAHELFFAHLRLRLLEACAEDRRKPLVGLVGRLGELLCEQFRVAPLKEAAAREDGRDQREAASNRCDKGNGHKLLAAYAKFCGQHSDSSRYYKQLMQSDKGFKQFIEQCNKQHPACRQRGVPECNLLVTQRLTKYPLLIDQLIKTSKDDPEEEQALRRALAECKTLLAELNSQLARKESFERLLGIYAQFCPKSFTIYNRHLKFTKHDLLQHRRLRQLVHSDGQVRVWSAQRRKLFQVLCLILNDILVFLRVESAFDSDSDGAAPATSILQQQLSASDLAPQGSECETGLGQLPLIGQCSLINVVANALHNQHHPPLGAAPNAPITLTGAAPSSGFSVKYYFANIDQKSSVISLSKLLIREKAANDTDGPRIYLISSSPRQPEMYELAFASKRHQTNFVQKLKSCVEQYTRSLLEGDAEDVINDEPCHQGFCAEHAESVSHETGEEDEELDENDRESLFNGASLKSSRLCLSAKPAGTERSQAEAEFALDIEQDVIIPKEIDLTNSDSSSTIQSLNQDGSLSLYETPKAESRREEPEQDALSSEVDEKGAERDNELVSNESGLSERARDSMDESCPLGKKVRVNQRRRRNQRPRNVSNQSSSSSEAGHRQAIELIRASSEPAYGEQLDVTNATSAPKAGPDYLEEDFDSGRGQDDSSSSASTHSNSLESNDAKKTTGSDGSETPAGTLTKDHTVQNLNGEEAAAGQQSGLGSGCKSALGSSASSTSSCSSSGQMSATLKTPQRVTNGRASNLVKCSSVLSKSACTVKQQRKLSTVSTMSSQLLNKFKPAGSGSNQSDCYYSGCSQCASQRAHGGSLLLSKQSRLQSRRASFVPEQKLEELRDLRIQLDKDKQEWQAKFDRMQEQLLNERRELDLAREKLKQDRLEVANEREQLYRKLDLLREKGILLSPSHKVIIKSPESLQQQNLRMVNPEMRPSTEAPSNVSVFNSRGPTASNLSNQFQNATCSIRISQALSASNIEGRQATNLFIQNQPISANSKVPIHLSESGQVNSGSISIAQRVTSSLALNKFPPLMQVLGGSIGITSASPEANKNPNQQHVESKLI